MSRYSYKAYDASGALTEGEVQSPSREDAIESLHRQGLYALEVDSGGAAVVATRWWEREIFAGNGSLPLAGLATFTRELATLVRADLPLDETLRIVALQPLMPARVRVSTQALHDAVRQGTALSAAMAAQGVNFPEYYWRLIEAGETSGSLGDVLDDLAGFVERQNEARSQVASALIYPLVLMAAALVTVGIVVTVLVPAVMPLFEDAGAQPPFALRFLAELHSAVSAHWPLALIGIAGTVAALFALFRNERFCRWRDRVALRIPLWGRLIVNRETGRFARTLGTMSRNGVPLLDGVRIAQAALSNRAFAKAVSDSGSALKEGGTLSQPLQQSGLFPELALRLVAVGEQTGQLDTMLMRVATIYEATLQRQMSRFVTLLTPALTLVVGFVVGGLILSVMGAIMSVNELALR